MQNLLNGLSSVISFFVDNLVSFSNSIINNEIVIMLIGIGIFLTLFSLVTEIILTSLGHDTILSHSKRYNKDIQYK